MRLGISMIEYGVIGIVMLFVRNFLLYLISNKFSFMMFVFCGNNFNLSVIFFIGLEFFVGVLFVFSDNMVCGIKYGLSRLVVLFEFDDFGIWKIMFEVQDIGKISVLLVINILLVIINNIDVFSFIQDQFYKIILDFVGVLVFIN